MSIFAEGTNGPTRPDMVLDVVMVHRHILVKKPEIT